jgi:zinc-ribbon domain
MAFCTHCGLRLTPTAEKCPHCGTHTDPNFQEHDSQTAIITMPPEHVLKRRKAFPIRDALYLPPEYNRSKQGARVIRKTYWLALSGLFLICLFLLISVYSLLSAGFTSLQGLLVPIPGSPTLQITSLYHEVPLQYTILPTPTALSHAQKDPHATPSAVHVAIQEAKEVIIHYYHDINARNYQKAYALWIHNPYNYLTFSGGFAHTRHDTITFGPSTPQSSSTIRITLTIKASEQAFNGTSTQLSFYQGYYLVQRQSHRSWKIIAANFRHI